MRLILVVRVTSNGVSVVKKASDAFARLSAFSMSAAAFSSSVICFLSEAFSLPCAFAASGYETATDISSIITSFRSMLIFISPLPDLSLDERRPTRSAGKREELVALNGLFRPNVIIYRADTFCIDRDGASAPFPSKLVQHEIHTASCARDIASFYSKNRFWNLRRF